MDKKNEGGEVGTLVITTTERFQKGWGILKLILVGFVGILILYGLFAVFGGYFFASFFIALIIISITINNFYEVDGELVLECRIGSEKGESKGDVIGIDKVPCEMFVDYKSKGANIKKFTTKTGKSISIVEKIDHVKKRIIYPWFSELSDFEFFIKKGTYVDLKKKFKDILDDILKTKETRELYYQIEHIKMLDYLESEEDIKEIKSKLEKILK